MKINLKNSKKVFESVDKVQAKCSVRLFGPGDEKSLVKEIEQRLVSLKVPKNCWVGMKFRWTPDMQSFPNSYFGCPEGTSIVIERYPSGWFMTGCERRSCNGSPRNALQFLNESEYKEFFTF